MHYGRVKNSNILIVVVSFYPAVIKKGGEHYDCKRRIFKQIKKIFWIKSI